MSDDRINHFVYSLIGFLSNLHNCHVCKYVRSQIHVRSGKERTFCTKYSMPIQKAQNNCIDRFDMTYGELNRIKAGYTLRGERPLVIDGVAV